MWYVENKTIEKCEFCSHPFHGLPCEHKDGKRNARTNVVMYSDCKCVTAFVDKFGG